MGDRPDSHVCRPPGRRGLDGGQAAVELALVLPLVALLALALVQVGLVVRAQVLVTHAAREGARAAAVDADPDAARRAAEAGAPLDPARVDVEVHDRGERGARVRVVVRYAAPTDVPLVGSLVGDPVLTASATMRVE
jgi:Flp pilus assembly protein TadG